MTLNTRRKGQRSFRKALAYARSVYPTAYLMSLPQISRWAQPQPADFIIFHSAEPPILVEVRTGQWGVAKPSTRTLAAIPGLVTKQIWMFARSQTHPRIREWDGTRWIVPLKTGG